MEKKVRILIVEDEFITLDMLRDFMENSGYEVSGDAMKADEAIDILERFNTDLVILDINLKGENDGIWLAEQIRQNYHIPFIFLSAYSDAATIERAVSTNPYGYLVKPFTQADVFAAIEVALKNFPKEIQPLDLPEQQWTEGTELLINQFLFVKDNLSFKKIDISAIRYVQAYKNYIELNMGSQRVVIRSTLQKFTNILPESHFCQTHRSFVVNIKYVDEIASDSITIGGEKIPLSKSFKDRFVRKFNFFI